MKHVKSLLLFLLLGMGFFHLILLGKELKSISYEKVLSIGDLDNDVLYMWAGITTDLEGNIYVTDSMDYSIKKFNENGILLKKAGRKGQGPGEFLAPRLIKYFNGLIYVTDQNITGIQVFYDDLNYKDRIPCNFPIFDLKIVSENRLIISTPFSDNGLIIIDSKGNPEEDIKYFNEGKDYWNNFKKFEIDNQNNLYLISSFEDKIEKYDANMKKLFVKSLLGKKEVKRKKTKLGPPELPTEIAYKDIASDISGNLFILGGHISKNPSKDVYVLDQSGKHLTTFTLPESSHCIHIDSRNFLYSRANKGITIKKYSLKYIYE